ncbi:MAG: hypothetical protein ACK4N5_25575, partial [Myxococcales bacterium]
PALTSERTFFARDTVRMHGPIRDYAAARLKAGELPLWWPFEGMGTPFLAQGVTAVLHPFALAVVPFSQPVAIKLMTLACYALAALGTFLLARALALSRTASVAAALAYALSGYTVSMSNNWTFLAGATALPGFLWGVELLARRSWRYFAVAAAFLSSMVLAGDYQASYVAAGAGLAWALARGEGRRGKLQAVLALGAAGAAAGLVCAVQLAGSWELLHQSIRQRGFSDETAMRWSLPPILVPELFLGPLFPVDTPRNVANLLWNEPLRGVWAPGVELGGMVLLLALVAAFTRRERHPASTLLAVLAAVGLLLAMGPAGGLYRLAMRVLPLWGSFRFPEKLLPLLALPASVLAPMLEKAFMLLSAIWAICWAMKL